MTDELREKIDFLMRVTGTENAVFARTLKFDASYISRIRRGQRRCPSDPEFISAVALFFSHAIREPYQRSAVAERISPGLVWPETEDEAREILTMWLSGKAPQASNVERMLAVMRGASGHAAEYDEMSGAEHGRLRQHAGTQAMASLFYGDQGKRDGVQVFLELLARTGKPQTLLLHSDEDMRWLVEDPSFAGWWMKMMKTLLENGCAVKIIHSIDRNLEEMLTAVHRWMPLYFTEKIEPYYYPHLQDRIFRRTMFVAPGQAALISRSIQGQDCDPINILIRDSAGVNSLEAEFRAFLSQCRPLFDTLQLQDTEERDELLHRFLEEEGALQAVLHDGQAVFYKEDLGALIMRADAANTVFLLKEQRIVSAIEAFLNDLRIPVIRDGKAALDAWDALLGRRDA